MPLDAVNKRYTMRMENLPDDAFSTALLNWFDEFGRHDLPWQSDKSAYRVWVSEIMLQQTQVKTVIPYYEKFMARFPTILTLAESSQDEVLSHWAGLGYYARGRNLHKAAQVIVQDYAGQFPNDLDRILALPGIGKSTAHAILSIVWDQPFAILDGNVKRVLCRYDAVEGWSGEKPTEAKLWQRAQALMSDERCGDYTQAIMDLGATLCRRSQPACDICPLNAGCQAYQTETVAHYPVSKPKKDKPEKTTSLLVCMHQDLVWLQKRPQSGIWGGLWCFPTMTTTTEAELMSQDLIKWPSFKHTFTHYHLHITPCVLRAEKSTVQSLTNGLQSEGNDGKWVTLSQAKSLGVPAPIKRIIEQLE